MLQLLVARRVLRGQRVPALAPPQKDLPSMAEAQQVQPEGLHRAPQQKVSARMVELQLTLQLELRPQQGPELQQAQMRDLRRMPLRKLPVA